MSSVHFAHRIAQVTLVDAVERLVTTTESLSDYDLLAASRCYGWTVLDLVVHVDTGLQEMLAGFPASSTNAPADQDAASYWRDYLGDDDAVDAIMGTRRTSAAYQRPSEAVQHLRMTADGVRPTAQRMRGGRVAVQDHTLTSGDFLASWAVELAVHQLDLSCALEVADPTPGSVNMARRTIEALLDAQLPTDWSDITCTLLGAGRRAPNTLNESASDQSRSTCQSSAESDPAGPTGSQ